MEYQTPKSTCNLCGSEYTGQGMARHIKACLTKHLDQRDKRKAQTLLYLKVVDTYNSDYFLHLLLPAKTPLARLDSFLRDIWLECCGHMSAFSFEPYGDELDMALPIVRAFDANRPLIHQYDFGSTTELLITQMGRYRGTPIDPIQILCRNAAPIIPCDECKSKPAAIICTECSGSDSGWLCRDCAEVHECDEDMYLPVVNSPRTGVCAYEG